MSWQLPSRCGEPGLRWAERLRVRRSRESFSVILSWLKEARMTLDERLEKIEAMLVVLVQRQTVKEFYDVEEVAQQVGKACFTVREWARLGRINGQKRGSGRGAHAAWAFPMRSFSVISEMASCPRHGARPHQKRSTGPLAACSGRDVHTGGTFPATCAPPMIRPAADRRLDLHKH